MTVVMMVCEEDVVVSGMTVYNEGSVYEAELNDDSIQIKSNLGVGVFSKDDKHFNSFRNATMEEIIEEEEG